MKKSKVLSRAESILIKYNNDSSIYYRELNKTYKEYKRLKDKDKVVDDLYINHINDLCDLVTINKKPTATIITMVIILIITIVISSYSTIKYYDISTNLKNNILKMNQSSSLKINYKNIESFSALELSSEDDYLNLTPLEVEIINISKNNKDIHYDIYLIEDNSEINKDEVIPKEVFLYDVLTSSRDSGVKKLSDAYQEKDKLRIFSGSISSSSTQKLEIRLWIDSNTSLDYQNKLYRFKIFINGYEK